MVRRRPVVSLSLLALVTAVYGVAGKLGLMLAFVHPSASAVWPPTGIALAAVLLLGFRVWPAIFLGAFLVNVTTAGSVATSIGIAAGNTLEGLTGALLVNWFAHGRNAFERPRNLLAFVALAALLGTTISATFGVTSLALGGFAAWAEYGRIWWTWWLGDAAGAVIVTPLLVLWAADWRVRWDWRQAMEALLLLASLVVAGQITFGGWLPTEQKNYPLDFLCVPLLVWAAFRFGPRETALASFIVSGVALSGTLRGLGPFVSASPNESLLLLQVFMGFTTVLALIFAVLVAGAKRAEDELRKSETTARAFLESAGEGVLIVHGGGSIMRVNAKAEEMFGYKREELVGQPVELLLPERLQSIHTGHRAGFLSQPRVRPMGLGLDLAGRRKDGTEFPVEISLSYVETEQGIRVLAFITDITERKRAEEELRRWGAELEDRVAERTAQLDETNKELETFTYSVSHDLRAPLRAMRGFAGALLEDCADRLDPAGQDYARRIVAAAERMGGLISDLLAYSRLRTADLPRRPVDLAAVVADALAQLEGDLRACGAEVNVEELPWILGHYPTLVQAVANLLMNAIKFVAPGVKPHVRVRAEAYGSGRRLWVEDNGIGIAPEHQERIFYVFERLHGRETYPGMGIGLAVVRKAVERLGGRVGVESAPGQGSRFWVELPKMEEPQ